MVVTLGDATGIWWIEARDATKRAKMHRTTPTPHPNEESSGSKCQSGLRNPETECYNNTYVYLLFARLCFPVHCLILTHDISVI